MANKPTGFEDYKDEVIQLKKALSALKRGKPTNWDLKVLGCSVDEFWHVNQYLVANQFNIKERAEFIKRLENIGVDLFDAYYLKSLLNLTREKIKITQDCIYLEAIEMILGNLLFNEELVL